MSKVAAWIAIGIGAVLTGGAALGYLPLIGVLSNATITTFFALGSTLVLNGISTLLTKKPGKSLIDNAQSRAINVRQAAAPHRVIYGQPPPVGGVITYLSASGAKNENLHMVLTIAGHEVQEIGTMYFDGVEVPVDGSGDAIGTYRGFVHVEKNLGTASQTAFPSLMAAMPGEWTSAHRQRGRAGAYIRLTLDKNRPDLFNGAIPQVTFAVKGRKLQDERLSPVASAWSSNAALALADYLANTQFGLSVNRAQRIDSSDLIATANICDESVALNTSPVTYEARYAFDCVFEVTADPKSVIADMCGAMAGHATRSGGVWHIRAGAWRASSLSLTDDDFIAPLSAAFKASRRELINTVRGTIISNDFNGQAGDFPAVQSAAALAEDGGQEFAADISLPGTTSQTRAQRLAKIVLESGRRQITVTTRCKLRVYNLVAGDTADITHARFGWSAKTFQVAEVGLLLDSKAGAGATLGVALKLREIDADVYAWSPSDEGAASYPGTPSLDRLAPALAPATGTALPPSFGARAVDTARLFDTRETTLRVVEEDDQGFLHVPVNVPARQQSTATRQPIVSDQPTIDSTGGFIPGDQVLYYAFCAVDGAAMRSKRSKVFPAVIPAGTDTNKVTIDGLLFDSGAVAFDVFRGRDPNTLLRIAQDVTLAASYVDDGKFAFGNPAPDIRIAGVIAQWRRVQSVFAGPFTCDAVDAGSPHLDIQSDALALSVNEYAGRIIEVVRNTSAAFQGQRAEVVSNTADTLTVKGARVNISAIVRSGNVVTLTHGTEAFFEGTTSIAVVGVTPSSFNGKFSATPISPTQLQYAQTDADDTGSGGYADTGMQPVAGFLFIVHYLASAAGDDTIEDADAAWTVNEWAGFRVRIIHGPGIHQERTIVSNTATELTVDSPWTDDPTGASFEIVDGAWSPAAHCPVTDDGPLVSTLTAVFQVPSLANALIEYTVQSEDAAGKVSAAYAAPVTRYCLIGSGSDALGTFRVAKDGATY